MAEMFPLVQSLMALALPGHSVLSAEPLDGIRNQTFRVRVSGLNHCFALRIYRCDPTARAKEVALYSRLQGQFPAPTVLFAQTEPLPFALLTWIEGIPFRELKRQGNLADLAEASRDVGKKLAALSRIQFDDSLPPGGAPRRSEPLGFGDSLKEARGTGDYVLGGKQSSWYQLHTNRRVDIAARPQTPGTLHQRLNADEIHQLLTYIDQRRDAFDSLYQQRSLVHGDFGSRNILVSNESGRWKVAGFIDFELAFAGSPLWDVSHFLCYERRGRPVREPHFSEGFREGGGHLPDDWRDLTTLLNVLSLSNSLTRPSVPQEFIGELRELLTAAIHGRGAGFSLLGRDSSRPFLPPAHRSAHTSPGAGPQTPGNTAKARP